MTIKGHGCMKSLGRPIKMRFIASGGVLKGILKSDDEITRQEMINVNGDDTELSADDGTRYGFSYMPQHRRYVYNQNSTNIQNNRLRLFWG